MIQLPKNHNNAEEKALIVSNVLHTFLHPFKPEKELRSFLESFGLYKEKQPNIQGAADFIQDIKSNRVTNNPEFLHERSRLREIDFRGRATPIIGRASRHKGTDYKLCRKHIIQFTPQIYVDRQSISILPSKQALKAIQNYDTTAEIKAELMLPILKKEGLL